MRQGKTASHIAFNLYILKTTPQSSRRCEAQDNAKTPPPSVDKKRARKKYTGLAISRNLMRENPDSPLFKSYERSTHCMETLTPNGEGRLTAHYCKNRWCPVCQSIRIAVLINGYKPQLEKFKDPWFVTLTRPTVTAEKLPWQIKHMAKCFRQIKNRKRMRSVPGLKKAECTTRPFGMYHYHFHVIIEGKENAEYLIKSWLELNPDSSYKAEHMRKADCSSMTELFKYFTKLLAKDKDGNRHIMDYKRLDVIFQALSGKRIFQPFGGLRMVSEEIEEEDLVATREIARQAYEWVERDWYGTEEGDALTNYDPSPSLTELLSKTIGENGEVRSCANLSRVSITCAHTHTHTRVRETDSEMGASPQTPEVFLGIAAPPTCVEVEEKKKAGTDANLPHSFQCADKDIPGGSLLSVAPYASPCDRKVSKITAMDKKGKRTKSRPR